MQFLFYWDCCVVIEVCFVFRPLCFFLDGRASVPDVFGYREQTTFILRCSEQWASPCFQVQ